MNFKEQIQNYFKARESEDRPVLLMTIGIPGSGKSFFLSGAEANFVCISADALREEFLKECREKSIPLVLRGEEKIPNEKDARDVFAPELREWVRKTSLEKLHNALEQKKNILLDITAVNLLRVYYTMLARQHGYLVDAVVFEPASLDYHLKNIRSRVEHGGLDLAPQGVEDKDSIRRKIIESVLQNFKLFGASIKEDERYFENKHDIPHQLPAETFKYDQGNFTDFLNNLKSEDRQNVETLVQEDVFNKVLKIQLRDIEVENG